MVNNFNNPDNNYKKDLCILILCNNNHYNNLYFNKIYKNDKYSTQIIYCYLKIII